MLGGSSKAFQWTKLTKKLMKVNKQNTNILWPPSPLKKEKEKFTSHILDAKKSKLPNMWNKCNKNSAKGWKWLCFLTSFLLRKGGGIEDGKCVKENFILTQIIENHSLN